MKRLLLITLLIGYIYPCVAQDKPIRTEESLEGTVIYKKTTTFEVDGYTYIKPQEKYTSVAGMKKK